MNNPELKLLLALIALAFCGPAGATTYTDNFQGTTTSLNWWVPTPTDTTTNAACLTAGTGNGSSGTTPPGCKWSTPDAVGSGALRLTDAKNSQHGDIVSNFTFPSTQGLQVTFTTYTYGGDGGGAAGDGADGISFFLMDASYLPTYGPNIGGWGGSLGYTCSNVNTPYNGMVGAYLGLGIDEYGNFLNQGDNTATGYGYQPMRIGLRGAGNVSWAWLHQHYPSWNPSGLNTNDQATGVQNTCETGTLWKYSSSAWTDKTVTSNTSSGNDGSTLTDYAPIPGGYVVMPDTNPIANQESNANATRANARPITYKLKITPAGLLSFWYSYNNGTYQPVLVGQSITASNGTVPGSFAFGFAGSTGGSTNVHEITCFTAQPIESSSSASANTIQSGQLQTGTQIYLAYYSEDNWWGGLSANNLVSSANGTVSASSVANWDASCVLTGGACSSTGASNTTAEALSSRHLLTWNGSIGKSFEPGSLTTIQTGVLNGNSTGNTASDLVNWLRGDRSQESSTLRQRTSVLGDIINSSPVWVGPPASKYSNQFNDALYGSNTPENANGAQTYGTFATNNATRENVVYGGANDGFLHGFRSGSFSISGTYDSTNNDGTEVIGFMPYGVLANIGNSSPAAIDNLTTTTYGHSYFVDATPGTGDLFYNGTWHTWLVGGLGTGGQEIYALDITDPSQFNEANASSLVIGDWTASSTSEQTAISCTNAAGCNANLGYTKGTPLIRRLHNGQWAIIFGNGINSSSGHAGVYIGLVDSTTGAVSSFRWLDTGTGSTGNPDGINYVSSADLDGDHVADYLYGGDLQGNVWRFNLTSSNPADWAVSKFGNASATPLFTATYGGVAQPITTQASVAWTTTGGQRRVMVMFGTGQITPKTATTPDVYTSGTQSVYGIWDWDMNNWNNGTTTASGVNVPASSITYAALSGPQSVGRSNLQVQTTTTLSITPPTGSQITGYRTSSTNSVCWPTCASGSNKYGWYMDLPGTQEQVIYNPVFVNGALELNTTIPPGTTLTSSCNASVPTGWLMAFNIATGGGFPQSFFPDATGSFSVGQGLSAISGIAVGGVGSPGQVSVGSQNYSYTQTSTGSPVVTKINPQGGLTGSRVLWEQLR